MAKNIQNLNVTNLKKEVKKISSQTEHTVLIGDSEYKIKIDDKFRKTKQYQLLDDLIEFFNVANDKVKLFEVSTPYVSLLFVKHFTNVEVSEDIDESLELLNILVDLNILGEILNLMPEKEVIEVYELLNVTIDRMRENMEITAEEAEKLSDVVENPELAGRLNGEVQ